MDANRLYLNSMRVFITEQDQKTTITISNKEVNIVIKMILIILVLFSIAGFVMLPLRMGLNEGTGMMMVIFVIVCIYNGRLLLWNFYGKETIELFQDKVVQTFDYRLFKDVNTIENMGLKMTAQNRIPKKEQTLDSDILDKDIQWATENNKAVLFNDKKEFLQLNAAMTLEEINQILSVIYNNSPI